VYRTAAAEEAKQDECNPAQDHFKNETKMTIRRVEIRPAFLKAFYEQTFVGGESPQAYKGATLEEFLTLARRLHPQLTSKGARSLAPPALRALLPDLGTVEESPELPSQELRGANISLKSARVDVSTESLELEGAKRITDWESLRRWKRLRSLKLSMCDAEDQKLPKSPLALDELEAREVTAAACRMALGCVTAKRVEVELRSGTLDSRWIRAPEKVKELILSADRIIGLEGLQGAPIEDLSVSCSRLPSKLAAVVGSMKSLRRLSVACEDAFGPVDVLGSSKHARLDVVQASAFKKKRPEWIAFAVAHPTIAFEFVEPLEARVAAELACDYGGFPIVKVVSGGMTAFEVAADFASHFGIDGDNGDVEDLLRKRAAELDAADLSSEGEQIIFRGKTLAAAKKFVDTSARVLGI